MRCIFDSMPSKTAGTQPALFRRAVSQSCDTSQSRQLSTKTKRQWPSRATPESSMTQQRYQNSQFHTSRIQKAEIHPLQNAQQEAALDSSTIVLSQSSAPAIVNATFQPIVEAPATQVSEGFKPLVLSKSLQTLLPAIEAQKPHYITAHVHSFPYILTEGDTLRLPFQMKGVMPGDILRFNRATIIGSRDYTLKAGFSSPQHSSPPHVRGEAFINKRRTGEPNYIDERLFECRMRVLGLDSSPMMIKEKKKRRIRRMKTVTSKHKYTVLKVVDIKVKTLEELKTLEGEQIVLE